MNKEYYLVQLTDRHQDDEFYLFTKPELAIQKAKDIINSARYKKYEWIEDTPESWLYFANVAGDSYSVKVITVELS